MHSNNYFNACDIVLNNYRMYSGLKKRQYNYYLNSTSPVEGQEQAFEAIELFTEKFIYDEKPVGLLLVGGVGSGKTFMVSSVANNIIDTIKITDSEEKNVDEIPLKEGYSFWYRGYGRLDSPVQFISIVDLMNQLKASFKDPDSGLQEMIMKRIKAVDLLILDDMGAEKSSDWIRETLFEIIDYRYNERLPILVTTNCTPEELKQQIGARNFDRLREMCALVSITAKSQRPTANVKGGDTENN